MNTTRKTISMARRRAGSAGVVMGVFYGRPANPPNTPPPPARPAEASRPPTPSGHFPGGGR